MADIQTVAQAKLTAMALGKWLGVTPELDIQQDYVRIYWPPGSIQIAQRKFKEGLETKDSKIRVDLLPVLLPVLIEKYGIFAAGALISAFMLGRQ